MASVRPDDKAMLLAAIHRYEKILATTPSGFWVADLKGNLLDVNEAYTRMSGYTRDELLGMRIPDLEANETADDILRHTQLIRERKSDQFETRHRRKDGTLIDVAITASYLGAEAGEVVVFVQDITERKRAEHELRRSEAEYRHLVQHAPTGIYEIEYAGPRFKRVNDAMCRILGYTREELLNLSPFELLDEDSKRLFQERIRNVLSGEEIDESVGFRVLAKDGREICAALSLKLTYTDGRPTGALVVAHDITERKRAEHALRESEDRLRIALDAARFGVFDYYHQSGKLTCDSRMKRVLGLQADEELDYERVIERIHPQDREPMRQLMDPSLSPAGGGDYHLEFRVRWPDGTLHWHEARGRVYFDAGPDGTSRPVRMAGVESDVTDRKRIEQTEERLRALMNQNPSLVFMKDESGRYVYLNRTYEEQFAAVSGDWYGKTDFEFWPKESAELFRSNDSEVLKSGRTHQYLEDSTDISGARHCWLCYKFPFTGSDNNRYVGGIGIDVTDRVRAEEALRTLNERLNEAGRRKDEFLAMLAHELRNPLAVISSASEVLRNPEVPRPEMEKAQDAMSRQLRHMGRLIDDLLDVSRVTQGKILLKREVVALSAIVDSAIEATRRLIDAKHQKLFVSIPGQPLLLDVDPVRLAQSISNVLQNAAKYTAAQGEIHLSAECSNQNAVIRIRDSGIGIDAQLLPRIFDLFVQGDRAPDRAQGGLGIGLTMARSLLELHGGRIEAFSLGSGRGSEFVIQLPLALLEAPKTAPKMEVEGVRSRRILVVDDNVDAVEMMRVLLEMDGHEVATAHDGKAAIEAAANFLPEVALVDLGMPGMDGYELARRLKQQPVLAQIMLVAVTGYGQEEDLQNSSLAGFDHHLVKPVDLEAIRRLLR